MPAEIGNKYWQLRKKHGKDKVFKSPEELWQKSCEYFEWIDDNQALKNDFKGKDVEEVFYAFDRPYTEGGLITFLKISDTTWENYCSGKKPWKDYVAVASTIKRIIRTNKFEGASIGFFSANIIARDLGLADKKEVEANVTGEMILSFVD